jgi:anti-sigma regulatory factor (Ser/Thr protein kinase)
MDVSIELRGDIGAASAARSVVSRFAPLIPPELVEDVTLLVSELVTNAVRHGRADEGRPVHLGLELRGDTVRVEVGDPGPGFLPGKPAPRADRTGGWGLVLLDRLAHRWGVEVENGTTVWFELGSLPPHALRPDLDALPASA